MTTNTQIQEPSLEVKYNEIFPENDSVENECMKDDNWLAQPYALKVVPSTTSSTTTVTEDSLFPA